MEGKKKVYMYTRVSTAMQVDGYSLEAQKTRMKMYAEFNDFEIVGEYEDAGKSGKSIEGRPAFNQMMEDIKQGKDNVSYVLVFKLSRFGRHAADVLSSLQIMQDFNVNLICVEDGIDSSKDAGKLMISVLSAVAEIERENIRVQTMEGRIQKAREGKWNGGFAPYGYKLVDGNLIIEEDEAEAIRLIFDKYVNTELGITGIARYLQLHGYKKKVRQNGKHEYFSTYFIKAILHNPVYSGKIAFGRRKTEKVHGTRNEYRQVVQKDYLTAEGAHEAIISDEIWSMTLLKLEGNARKYTRNKDGKNGRSHLLSGLLKCPVCGAPLYHSVTRKRKKNGEQYKEYGYYACKHRLGTEGDKCSFKKQIKDDLIESAVIEIVVNLVKKPQFVEIMKEKIESKVDTSVIEKEISTLETELRRQLSVHGRLTKEVDGLDPDDKHYERMKADLDNRIYNMYDSIDELEEQLAIARNKKMMAVSDKMKADNVYKILLFFDELYHKMNEEEQRTLMSLLISEIHVFEERTESGQWLKEVVFNLPIIDGERVNMSLDKENTVETVVLLSKNLAPKPRVEFEF